MSHLEVRAEYDRFRGDHFVLSLVNERPAHGHLSRRSEIVCADSSEIDRCVNDAVLATGITDVRYDHSCVTAA